MHSLWLAVAALLPTAGVAFLFYLVIKAMIEGDRRERLAHSQWEAQQEHPEKKPHSEDLPQ
ncbi:hypothetical protein [Oryzihumus leptocrescens]|uniref:Uncharacterized protein n=1 Tax=Oryzihumus leptocrescens TaxID=297536 RepID=A0A542ZN22_9MICO|nr:hypothetical protein [Oryzihumus leptocrescens]TQL61784.1 hypothetical protein FB474_3203 [Oryzihumus leptocrescens]